MKIYKYPCGCRGIGKPPAPTGGTYDEVPIVWDCTEPGWAFPRARTLAAETGRAVELLPAEAEGEYERFLMGERVDASRWRQLRAALAPLLLV